MKWDGLPVSCQKGHYYAAENMESVLSPCSTPLRSSRSLLKVERLSSREVSHAKSPRSTAPPSPLCPLSPLSPSRSSAPGTPRSGFTYFKEYQGLQAFLLGGDVIDTDLSAVSCVADVRFLVAQALGVKSQQVQLTSSNNARIEDKTEMSEVPSDVAVEVLEEGPPVFNIRFSHRPGSVLTLDEYLTITFDCFLEVHFSRIWAEGRAVKETKVCRVRSSDPQPKGFCQDCMHEIKFSVPTEIDAIRFSSDMPTLNGKKEFVFVLPERISWTQFSLWACISGR